MASDTDDSEPDLNCPTAEDLQERADEWSTEYVEFELSNNGDLTDVRRRYLVKAHYSTSAGRPVEWDTPSGFETLEEAAEFAKHVAGAAKSRRVRRR